MNQTQEDSNTRDPHAHYWKVDRIILKDLSGEFSLDLTNSLLRLELNSSMTDPFVYGNIQVSDYLNIIGELSIIGNQIIEVTIKSFDDRTHKEKFKVVKINPPLSSPAKSEQFYLIEFISMIGYKNLIRKFSKSYSNMNPTNIVRQIYEDYLKIDEEDGKKDNFITSQRTTSVVIPYMNPIDAISFLSLHSLSSNQNYDFVCYEDFKNFNFVPISELWGKEPAETFLTTHSQDGRQNDPGGEKDTDLLRQKIISYSIGGDMYDVCKNIKNGTYAATNINFDMTLKKVSNRLYSYHKHFKRTENHVELHPMVAALIGNDLSTENTSKIVITNEPSVTHDNNPKAQNILDSYFKRRSINNMFQQVMTIKMHSRFDLSPGQLVKLSIKSNKMNETDGEYEDTYLSGKFMVLNSAHFFERTRSFSTFILGRDSVPSPIASGASVEEGPVT